MRLADPSSLPAEPARCVIINVNTESVTTLALASALRHADMPVLLLNCAPTAASTAHFEALLADGWKFDILDAPLRTHGATLDWVFRWIAADLVLLLDSDAEIREPGFCARLRSFFATPIVFGAGFVNGPTWLEERHGASHRTGLRHERAWMPSVMFRTAHVRAALDAGMSFETRVIYNDLRWSRKVSQLLATRFMNAYVPRAPVLSRLPARTQAGLRSASLPWLAGGRREFYGHRPNYVYCDTGTDIFQWCRYQQQWVFAGLNVALLKDEVAHYQGVTRRALRPRQQNAAVLEDITAEVVDRLKREYGIAWDELAARSGLHGTA